MTVYFFDFDDTLYHFDHHARLPALAEITGASQYHLASSWWVPGFERRAEAGAYATGEAYLDAWREQTGTGLSLEQWQRARLAAMSPNLPVIAVLRECAERGTVSLLSNNPAPFRESLGVLAPDVAAILGRNDLVSADLGVRKPDPALFAAALGRFGVDASDAFFVDDSAANVAGARAAGITAFHVAGGDDEVIAGELRAAIAEHDARVAR